MGGGLPEPDGSRTVATANGSMYRTTTGPDEPICWATSGLTKNRTASQRGTARLRRGNQHEQREVLVGKVQARPRRGHHCLLHLPGTRQQTLDLVAGDRPVATAVRCARPYVSRTCVACRGFPVRTPGDRRSRLRCRLSRYWLRLLASETALQWTGLKARPRPPAAD
jgi:hypothetical protein